MNNRLAFCAFIALAACNADTFTADDAGLDAPSDGTLDGTTQDAALDAGRDATDIQDASEGGVIIEAGGGDGSGGILDASITCPKCDAGMSCCSVPASKEYGQCYATACLSCCM